MWEGSSRVSILGILLARTASGLLSDLAGWRSAYAVSAAITFAQLLALLRLVPNDARSGVEMRYTALVASIVRLFQTNRALHSRATQGFLIFTAITLLWTPMVLRCAPHSSRFLSRGWEIAAEFVEPGNTATDDRRPAFQAMIDAVMTKLPTFTIIVVHSFSWFFATSSSSSSTSASRRRTG